MADKEMSSDELMAELQWREDLSNLVNGSDQATHEMTWKTEDNQQQDKSEVTTSDESKSQEDWEKKSWRMKEV